jgi:amidase
MRGSVLGIGTDLAGGLRVPSMCCGLVGFKPSANRLPSGGQTQAGRRGGFGFHSSVGPIAHNVRDAEYLIQSIAQFDSWVFDDTALSIPWKPFAFTGPKRFGVIFEDPKYLLHPPVARNFREVIHKLTAASHQVISLANILPEDNISTTAFTAMTILNMDPEKTAHGFVARGNEPLVPSIASITMPELAKIKPNINGVFNLNNDISNVRAMFREVIVKHQLDAVLMPVYQSTAVEHDQLGVPAYTLLANLLDVSIHQHDKKPELMSSQYPACTIPYGYADKVLDAPFVRDVRYKPPCRSLLVIDIVLC